jgi:hypothetical protein
MGALGARTSEESCAQHYHGGVAAPAIGSARMRVPRWPELRAGLLLFVLVASCAEGCPASSVTPRQLDRPIGQRELARWSRLLGRDPRALRDDVLTVAGALSDAHAVVRAPFAPLFELTHSSQRWSLFPIADPDPVWMHVEGRVAGEWVLLYRPNDPQHALFADRLEQRRVRAVWNPGSDGLRGDQPRFVDWIAREIFAARPEVDAVRVRYQQLHLSLPHEAPRRETEWRWESVRAR